MDDTSNPTLRPASNASSAIQKNLAPLMQGSSLGVAAMSGVSILIMYTADAANWQTLMLSILFFAAAVLSNIIVRLGHAHLAAGVLGLVCMVLCHVPQLVTGHLSAAVALSTLSIPFAALYASRRGIIAMALFNLAMTWFTLVTLFLSGHDRGLAPLFANNMVGYTVLNGLVLVFTILVVDGALVLRSQVAESERALIDQNNLLETEVAERREAQSRLRDANAGLETRVAERTQALADTEMRFRSLVQHSTNIFAVLDINMRLHYGNPALFALSTLAPENLLGARLIAETTDLLRLQRLINPLLTGHGELAEPLRDVKVRVDGGPWVTVDVLSAARPAGSDLVYVTARDARERRAQESDARHHVALERVLSSVSSRFLSLDDQQIDEGIQFALAAIGEFLKVDICRVFLEDSETRMVRNAHEWCRAGVVSQQSLLVPFEVGKSWIWWTTELKRHGVLRLDTLARLKTEDPSSHDTLTRRQVSALVSAPLRIGDSIVGEIGFDMLGQPRHWTDEDVSLLQVCAGFISNALARARTARDLRAERVLLEERVADRTAVLARVVEVSNGLTAITDLPSLLGMILERLHAIAEFNTASISILEDDDLKLIARDGENLFGGERSFDYQADVDLPITDALRLGKPVQIDDVLADTPHARAFRQRQIRRLGAVPAGVRSALYVPLISKERALGVMALTSATVNNYSPQQADLTYAFANYAAAAIDNARSHTDSVRAAALEERSRLARELHDSVSQALFGIVLGTRTALHRIGEAPAEAEDPMKYVLSLAEGALSEMRALIFELRPESLKQQGLIAAFRKQAEALCARHKIDVRIALDTREPDIPLELKEALYRVALEAIQNTIKHAHATRVDLSLHQLADSVHLEISDNGLGFDTKQGFPGHYGLQTMQERIVRFGGYFDYCKHAGDWHHGARLGSGRAGAGRAVHLDTGLSAACVRPNHGLHWPHGKTSYPLYRPMGRHAVQHDRGKGKAFRLRRRGAGVLGRSL